MDRFFNKILAVIFILSVTGFVLTFRRIYPLQLTKSEGFLAQIPIIFWIGLSLSLLIIAVLVIVHQHAIFSFVATIGFYLLFSSYQFLFKGLFGGDYSPDTRRIMLENPFFDPEQYFYYLQWPNKYILFREQYLITGGGDDVLVNVERMFFLLVILFSISVWYFVYSSTTDPVYSFFGATLFLVIVHPFLNFQSVPQFFALSLLLFLFGIHDNRGRAWLMSKLTLFTALVLSHPMLYIFYLGAILLQPIFYGLWRSIGEFCSREGEPLYSLLVPAARSPRTTAQSTLDHTIEFIRNRHWLVPTALFISIYLTLYLYRFVMWQTQMISTMLLDPKGHTAAFIQRVSGLLGLRDTESISTEEIAIQGVSYLANATVSNLTTFTSMVLVAAVGLLLVTTFLFREHSSISPFQVSIFGPAIGYFSVGSTMNILGLRSFQIIFLPLITSVGIIRKFDTRWLLVVIVVILTVSPILVANSLNNATLDAGHKSGDYYTEESGKWISEYGTTPVLQSHSTAYPIQSTYGQVIENMQQTFSSSDAYIVESNSAHLIQFDYKVYHSQYYFKHQCNFDEQRIIYDNGNTVMWDPGGEFDCIPAE
ncbi:hypothetical protein [Natronoglomus mannanivorans]|uniref:Uncharacterized protein n=1 Tax=Natronoglomus mannanivorans TaxID=2979990 RepID=A0AAP2Z1L5_9EURY|nr:hypothetical protein [Halobacteria archaeon AArc-xg1-1]